jgi:hypothetical protein
MSGAADSSDAPAPQRLASLHEALVGELRDVLDLEAGLQDALIPAAHAVFTADVGMALDIERGLASALPDDTATASPSSGPEIADPGLPPGPPPSGPAPIGYLAADERANAVPPPPRKGRPRRDRDRGSSRDQGRNWTPPTPEEGE